MQKTYRLGCKIGTSSYQKNCLKKEINSKIQKNYIGHFEEIWWDIKKEVNKSTCY